MIEGNRNQTNNLLDLLLALKENIMRDTSVADFGKVTKVSEDGKYICDLINTNETVVCISFGISASVDDVVLILFTDTDFRVNLKSIQQGRESSEVNTVHRHSKNYGVIISNGTSSGPQITIDNMLSLISENPVQNKVLTLKINQMEATTEDKVPKQLTFASTDTTNKDSKFLYVDSQNETNRCKRVSLQQIKNMNTKILTNDDPSDDIDTIDDNDYIFSLN